MAAEIDPNDPRYDHDQQGCSVGVVADAGDRIPRVDLEIARTSSLANRDSPGWKLCSLSITTDAMTVSLVGLAAEDLRTLVRFLADYEQRLRDY